MGWLGTLLNWLLALLEWVCWPCRLVEWLGSLEQGAAITLMVGVLNAAAILAAAILAIQKADSVLRERAQTRRFDSAEEILAATEDACGEMLEIFNANADFSLMEIDVNESVASTVLHRTRRLLYRARNSVSTLQSKLKFAKIHHNSSGTIVHDRIKDIIEIFYTLNGAVDSLTRALEIGITVPPGTTEKAKLQMKSLYIEMATRTIIDANQNYSKQLEECNGIIFKELAPAISLRSTKK